MIMKLNYKFLLITVTMIICIVISLSSTSVFITTHGKSSEVHLSL